MATQDRLPTSERFGSWSSSSGATEWEMIDDPVGSPDDNTTYIFRQNTAANTAHYSFTAFAIDSSAVAKIIVTFRSLETTGDPDPTIFASLFVNGTLYHGSSQSQTTSYVNYTEEWLTNPDTGVAWVEADVEGTGANPLEEFRFRVDSLDTGDEARITQGYITVDYTEAGGDLDFQPTAASLIITQQQPTLVIGGTQAKDFQPDAASLVITGQQPTLEQSVDIPLQPAAASLVLTAEQPTLTQTFDIALQPTAGSLVITAEQPTLDIAAGGADHDFQPGAASLIITQEQPILTRTIDLQLVRFDGTNDELARGADLTGNADGKVGTVSFWVDFREDGTTLQIYTSLDDVVGFWRQPDNTIKFLFRGIGGATTLLMVTANTYTISSGRIHVLASWDLANDRADIYVNDVADIAASPTKVDANLNYTNANHFIGHAEGAVHLNGCLGQLYINFAEYIDIAIEANRRKFITEDLLPVDLGSDGSLPTGTAPIMLFDGALATWETNDGTGGGFTLTGALTDCDDLEFQPAAASLVITAEQPTLVVTGAALDFQPDAAALVITAEQPTLTQTFDFLFEPDAGSLVITAEQPTLSQTFDLQFQPDAASLVLTQQQPTLDQTFDIFKQPDAASVTITTEPPTLTQTRDIFLRPTAASIRITTSQPTMEIVAQADLEFQPTAASLVISTVQPELQIRVPPPPPPDDLTTTAQIPAPGSAKMILIPPTEQHRAQVEMTASAVIGGLRQFTKGKKKR